ncbi:MAG: hypothetical protein ACEY3K_03915 [Wolbachia sp.]
MNSLLEANDFYIIRELGDVPDDHVDRAREVIDHLFGNVNRVREVIDRLLGDNARPLFIDWMSRNINNTVLSYFWNRFSQEDRIYIANTVLRDPNLMGTILGNQEFIWLTNFIRDHFDRFSLENRIHMANTILRDPNLRTILDNPEFTWLTSFIDEHNLRTTLDDPNLTQLAHSSKRM